MKKGWSEVKRPEGCPAKKTSSVQVFFLPRCEVLQLKLTINLVDKAVLSVEHCDPIQTRTSRKNIARGTTDTEIDSVTWIEFINNMAPLALVAYLATRWRHLH